MAQITALSPKQVALALGVSEASLKRWCDRELIVSTRTAGGHRRIPVSSVLKFIRERQMTPTKPELLGLPSGTGDGELAMNRAKESAYEALVSGREEQFRRLLLSLYLGRRRLAEIFDLVVQPAFYQIGESWEHGRAEIFQERRACEICLRWVHEARALLPEPSENAPLALGGTLSHDNYMLAPAMADTVLREAGWRSELLGCNLPGATLCSALQQRRPRLLWLSVGYIADTTSFEADIAKIYAATQAQGIALVLGGRALTGELRRNLEYNAFCETLRHLAALSATLNAPTASTAHGNAQPGGGVNFASD